MITLIKKIIKSFLLAIGNLFKDILLEILINLHFYIIIKLNIIKLTKLVYKEKIGPLIFFLSFRHFNKIIASLLICLN